jgi:hypothetical protein
VQFGVNNLNELTTASRYGTLTVAGNVANGTGPFSVTVSGTGLASGAAEVYADGAWARPGATPANGVNTYTDRWAVERTLVFVTIRCLV